MKKYKNTVFTGLTIIVIIFCGMLPRIISAIEDCLVDKNVSYGEQKTVSLIKELNDVEKLYLLKEGAKVSITEKRTKQTWTEIKEVVYAALSWYKENGFIDGQLDDFAITKCEPVLYYSNDMSNVSGIFWEVNMELWDAYGQSITLSLDDQTGRVFLISYECLEPIYDKSDLSDKLHFLYEIYQSERSWNGYDFEIQENAEQGQRYKREMRFWFGDVQYGENGMVFIMTENGFSIQID